MSTSKVGASNRTPIKHMLYGKLLGQVVGAASHLAHIDQLAMIDACAGNGIATAFSGTSSPEITCKQLDWAASRRLRATGILVEKDPDSFAQLRTNAQAMPGGTLAHLVQDDYRSDRVAQQVGSPQAAFLHIDPNHVGDVELSTTLRAALPPLTTMLVTMGCNSGGLHRLPYDERKEWYGRLEYLLDVNQRWHDACLIRLKKDDAQWAYLLTVPAKWRPKTERVIRSVTSGWPNGAGDDWLSDGSAAFWSTADYLFLRKDGSEMRPA